jgi:uncharacterized protein Yka (UPF0111/DUF47 family)
MLWLKKLFGKDDRFFDLLEKAAEEAKASVDFFNQYLTTLAAGGSAGRLDELVQTRRKEKRIRQETTEALSRTFVTPLDREDIEALSFALYRVPKQVEKIVERISICPGTLPHAGFRRQVEFLLQASESVVFMVKQLRGGTHIDKIREANDRLQFAEGEADKVMLALLKELYQGDHGPKEMIILQELYEMIEQAVDRCRNVGNVVLQIALKNA